MRTAALTAALTLGLTGVAAADPAANAQSSPFLDELGRPTPLTVQKVNEFANQPFVPPQIAETLRTAVRFYAGQGQPGGPALPEGGPAFTQFLWPTVALNCMGPGMNSTASAIAVPGPTSIPAPGAREGQAVFTFTALGTPAAAEEQGGMNVYWVNVSNARVGVTPLGNNRINPTGPATLSGTADTGAGTVLAVVGGSVRTTSNVCFFAPTAASFNVR